MNTISGLVRRALIGETQWRSIDPDLVETISKQNQTLNKKFIEDRLYLNKQGVVLVAPRDVARSAQPMTRLSRSLDLAETAYIYQHFLDEYAPGRRSQGDFADYVFMLVRSWVRQPRAILAASFTNSLAWGQLSAAFCLEEKLKFIEEGHPTLERGLNEKRAYFTQIADKWWNSGGFAASIDSVDHRRPEAILSGLQDSALRESILEDIEEARTSLTALNYKAAVVLAGS